jgi:hypothetical protein
MAYTPMLITYTLEILPYAIRAKGFALMVRYGPIVVAPLSLTSPQNLVVSLALAVNQSVDPWALNAIGWKYVGLKPFPLKRAGLIDHSTSFTVGGWASSWSSLSYS